MQPNPAVPAFAQGFLDAVPDAVCSVRSSVQVGDTVVVEWTWSGTHAGDMEGWPATGGAFASHGCSVVRLEGDLISTEAAYWDKETLFSA